MTICINLSTVLLRDERSLVA